jgi:hypothetical protein
MSQTEEFTVPLHHTLPHIKSTIPLSLLLFMMIGQTRTEPKKFHTLPLKYETYEIRKEKNETQNGKNKQR